MRAVGSGWLRTVIRTHSLLSTLSPRQHRRRRGHYRNDNHSSHHPHPTRDPALGRQRRQRRHVDGTERIRTLRLVADLFYLRQEIRGGGVAIVWVLGEALEDHPLEAT